MPKIAIEEIKAGNYVTLGSAKNIRKLNRTLFLKKQSLFKRILKIIPLKYIQGEKQTIDPDHYLVHANRFKNDYNYFVSKLGIIFRSANLLTE